MTDLASELRVAAEAVSPLDVARLRTMGVINPGFCAFSSRQRAIGLAYVSDAGGGLFVPDPDGQRSVIVPVFEGDDLVDLVAFRSATPESWLLRRGAGWALGLESSLERYRWGDVLPVHRTPLDWLTAGCDGLAIVDWSAPELCQLADLPALLISDDALERRVISALTRPSRLPHIVKDMPLAA